MYCGGLLGSRGARWGHVRPMISVLWGSFGEIWFKGAM